MAIDYKTRYPSKIDITDPSYPQGKARNIVTSGDGTGTPWEADLINDLFGFEQAVLAEAGITPTGQAGKVGSSQYLDGLKVITEKQIKENHLIVDSVEDLKLLTLEAGQLDW